MGVYRKLWPWVAAITSGVMLGLCYPNWDVGGLIWIWQMPLIAALWFSNPKDPCKRWRRGLGLGYVAGLSFFLVNLSWLFELGRTVQSVWAGIGAWLVMPVYLAIYFALWGAFTATAGRWVPTEPNESRKGGRPGDLFGPSVGVIGKSALIAAAWCGLEWLRGLLLTGFSWNGLGVAMHENIYLIQFADVVGATGLSFVIVFCNAVWTATLVRMGREIRDRQRVRPHLDFAVAVALVVGLFLYGTAQIASRPGFADDERPDAEKEFVEVRALLVQLNVPIDREWTSESVGETIDRYRFFTRSLGVEFSDFDLVMWPETSLPGRFNFPWVQQFLNEEILNAADFYLLAGIEEEEFDDERIYNSVVLMRGSTESFQSHKKLHLVPFGEYVPYRLFMDPIFKGMVPRDFTAGTSTEPLKMTDPDVGIIPLVCFEDTIGRLARKFVRPEPQLMVNVTNDGWFWQSAESAQHLANAKFRCIELRRPMARSANTGVSCFISDLGSLEDPNPGTAQGLTGHQRLQRVQDSETGSTFVEGTQTARIRIPKNSPITFYARHGDAFSIVAGLIAAVAAGLSIWRRRKRRRV